LPIVEFRKEKNPFIIPVSSSSKFFSVYLSRSVQIHVPFQRAQLLQTL